MYAYNSSIPYSDIIACFQKFIPITCGEYSEVDAILSNCRNYLTMEGKFQKLKILILKIYIVLF